MEEKEAAQMMSRRSVLGVASAAAAMAAVESVFAAEGHNHDQHGSASHGVPKNDALARSALDCVKTGEDCVEHCLESFKTGDTSLAQCASLVRELVASCTALALLASAGSKHLHLFAQASRAICADCENECRKHKHHQPCIDCAEACAECIKQCDAFAS